MSPPARTGCATTRILQRVEVKDDCWEWHGAIQSSGYGQITVARQKWLAHRLAHELWIGPIPEGLHIDHLCGNRVCVNPDHLEAVPQAENNRRMWVVNRMTHCRRGHEFTPENTFVNQGYRGCRTCRRLRDSNAGSIPNGAMS